MRKSRRAKRKYKGGAGMNIPVPESSNTSSSGAIAGAINKQSEGNKDMTELNKKFSGGGKDDVTVPQMSQAGRGGNKTIVDSIKQMMQGSEDGAFDNDVHNKPPASGMPAGGGKRRKRRKSRRKRRKSRTKRRRKSRRRTKRKSKRKSRRKSRRK
jgi:hypothetical protein